MTLVYTPTRMTEVKSTRPHRGVQSSQTQGPTNGYTNGHAHKHLSEEARVLKKLLLSLSNELLEQNGYEPITIRSNNHSPHLTHNTDERRTSSDTAVNTSGEGDWTYEQLVSTVKRVVGTFERQYDARFAEIISRLDITPQSIESVVLGVMDELFADGEISWGRVVAQMSFVRRVSLKCAHLEMPRVIEPLIECSAHIADQHITPFVRRSGGWGAFIEFFAVEANDDDRTEMSTMGRVATLAVGAVGAIGVLAFLARR